MIFFMISMIIGLVSLQYFTLDYSIQGLNRVIISTPIEIMYKSVLIYGDYPLFKKNEFEEIVLSYYSKSLTKYTSDYDISFYYYNFIDGSICLVDKCGGVEISINCRLNITYKYHRVMFYEMREVTNG